MKIIEKGLGCEIIASYGDTLLDCDRLIVVEQVQHSGYVIFKNFTPTQEEFEDFTNLFGICAETRHVHYPSSGEALGFHAEDAYNPYRPDTLWFFCAYEGSDGGIPTGVVDGIALFNQLPDKWKNFCRTQKLQFNRQWASSVWLTSDQSYNQIDLQSVLDSIPGIESKFLSDQSIYIGYQAPIVTRTIEGHESFANSILQAISDPDFYGIALSDGSNIPLELITLIEELSLINETSVGWSTGDIAVIDNLRMMHRRSSYNQIDRDLRARHGENFFGSQLPETRSHIEGWVKKLIQGDIALPTRVGRPI